jgi:hypothetical protein
MGAIKKNFRVIWRVHNSNPTYPELSVLREGGFWAECKGKKMGESMWRKDSEQKGNSICEYLNESQEASLSQTRKIVKYKDTEATGRDLNT